MNRNIITEEDCARMAPKAEERAPDSTFTAAAGTATTTAPARVAQKADTYTDRLVKYVPMEVIGAYLLVEGLLKQMLTGLQQTVGLVVLFLLGLLATWFYSRMVLKVSRISQLSMSAFAFTVWVFATGGWFASLHFWSPAWGTIAVVVFALTVQILNVGPLPPEQAADPQDTTTR